MLHTNASTIVLIGLLAVLTSASAVAQIAEPAIEGRSTACPPQYSLTPDNLSCSREATIVEVHPGAGCTGQREQAVLTPDRTRCYLPVEPVDLPALAKCGELLSLDLSLDRACGSLPSLEVTEAPRSCADPADRQHGFLPYDGIGCIAPALVRSTAAPKVLTIEQLLIRGTDPEERTVLTLCPTGLVRRGEFCFGSLPQSDYVVASVAYPSIVPCPPGWSEVDGAAGLCTTVVADGQSVSISRPSPPREPSTRCPLGFERDTLGICLQPDTKPDRLIRVDAIDVVSAPGVVPACPPLFIGPSSNGFCTRETTPDREARPACERGTRTADGPFCELRLPIQGEIRSELRCESGVLDETRALCTEFDESPIPSCTREYRLVEDRCIRVSSIGFCPFGALTTADELDFEVYGDTVCIEDAFTFAPSTMYRCDEGLLSGTRCFVPVLEPEDDNTCFGFTITVRLGDGEMPTDGDDVILGTPGPDEVAAGTGNDIMCLLGGDDVAWGQAGDDTIDGGPGDDRIRGGPGDDTVTGGDGADDISGGAGDDIVLGQNGDDLALRGGTGDDLVDGGPGNDALVAGNGGSDKVRGGEGDDLVTGGPRPDLVEGGPGTDIVRGGGGNDFVFGNVDDESFGGAGIDLLSGRSCSGGTTGVRSDGSIPVEADYAIFCDDSVSVP